MRSTFAYFGSLIAVLLTAGCGDQVPLGAERYASSDAVPTKNLVHADFVDFRGIGPLALLV
jgi:hypothetical protein